MLYEKSPDAVELGLFGFSEDDFLEEEKTFSARSCNWQAVQLFIALTTRWRVGMPGATGFDYDAIAAVIGCHGTKPRKRKPMLRKTRAMKIEVLTMWAQEYEQRNQGLYYC